MGLFDNVKGYMKNFNADKKKFEQAEHYADLNKDGKVDKQDFDKVKSYTGKFNRK